MYKNKKEMLNSILEKYKELFVILREIDDKKKDLRKQNINFKLA